MAAKPPFYSSASGLRRIQLDSSPIPTRLKTKALKRELPLLTQATYKKKRMFPLAFFFNLHNRLTTLICNIGIQILLTSSNAFLSLIAERLIKFILVVNVLNCTVKFCSGKVLL